MKKLILLFVLFAVAACDRKIGYYDLKNENETYSYDGELYSGTAVSDVEAENPSTVYEFREGVKQSEIKYYPEFAGGKVQYEKNYSMGRLSDEKEFSKDGLLLREEHYSWGMDGKATASVTWYDWCGKAKRKKSFVCDKNINIKYVNYDHFIPEPCK
ncbi:hypothetical protein CHU92_01660 [Flavobacterium cyanobacteriorum]|uniref:Lipoprotein n=1 Tax=Flavobacterium cyanobacteriorum TaxID=2022802 RepID=A0A255ZXB1_9FLAO|nr:hypothetical protein [Flavobacterium cyanobacteriorum]OYQ46076.1 hypothetical protein CHU92_01660 [Flavobacterium cyanobacteriorum]